MITPQQFKQRWESVPDDHLVVFWVVAFVAFAWCAYEWAFVDDGPAYFTAEWRRVASVALFSVAGGFLVAVIRELPTPARHRVGATVFGVCV